MLPNFTIVICGAVLTVVMLAVTGSGLVVPETRTRIGEMPEIGRPMMQRMITEPAARAQFAELDLSRRADELGRLRDIMPAIVAEPAPAREEAQEVSPRAAGEAAQATIGRTARDATQEPANETGEGLDLADYDGPAGGAAAPPATAPAVVAAAAPPADRPTETVATTVPAPPTAAPAPIDAGSIERPEAGARAVAALSNAEETARSIQPGARLNIRLPRSQRWAKAAVIAKKPARQAVRHVHRHGHRAYAVQRGSVNPFGPPATQFR
jgi:hypothetical protein